MGTTPAQIEDAILSRLQADPTLATAVRTFELYDGPAKPAEWRAKGGAVVLPAVLVAYVGSSVGPFGGFDFCDLASFQVSVIARNLRGRRGGTREQVEAGAQDLMWRVRQLLSGQTLDLDMSELVPASVELLEYTKDTRASEFAVQFTTRVEFDLATDADVDGIVDDLDTITVDVQVSNDSIVVDTHTDLSAEEA